MKKLPVSKLQELFAAIRAQQALYIPADDASGQARYQPWQEGMELTHALNTVRSAKDFFFPQTENLVEFKLKGKQIGVLFRSEEWEYNGKTGWKTQPFKLIDVARIREGKFKVPKEKPLKKEQAKAISSDDFLDNGGEIISDSDLPF